MKGVALQSKILTDEERRVKLLHVIGNKLQEPGKLHLPTSRVYNQLTGDTGLQQLCKEYCRWLGIKHETITVSYGKTLSYDVTDDAIKISDAYRAHPYGSAALLCLATLSYYLKKYTHETPTQAEIEFATIETGLGLWILNGLKPRLSKSQSLYHFIDTTLVHNEGITLSDYSPSYYANKIVEYAHEHRIPSEEYIGHINKKTQHLLPNHLYASSKMSLPDPDIIHALSHNSRILWIKTILIVIMIAIVACLSLYFWSASKPITNAEMAENEKALRVVKSSYDSCIQVANTQQNSYDPNDLFMTRQVDATRARCESLRNEYNYALDQYQDALRR